jgi:hypothetical protein
VEGAARRRVGRARHVPSRRLLSTAGSGIGTAESRATE